MLLAIHSFTSLKSSRGVYIYSPRYSNDMLLRKLSATVKYVRIMVNTKQFILQLALPCSSIHGSSKAGCNIVWRRCLVTGNLRMVGWLSRLEALPSHVRLLFTQTSTFTDSDTMRECPFLWEPFAESRVQYVCWIVELALYRCYRNRSDR